MHRHTPQKHTHTQIHTAYIYTIDTPHKHTWHTYTYMQTHIYISHTPHKHTNPSYTHTPHSGGGQAQGPAQKRGMESLSETQVRVTRLKLGDMLGSYIHEHSSCVPAQEQFTFQHGVERASSAS
jgi:hypothetical protein